jgi:Tat protein secretion system quality control protein TatD with DNase activity
MHKVENIKIDGDPIKSHVPNRILDGEDSGIVVEKCQEEVVVNAESVLRGVFDHFNRRINELHVDIEGVNSQDISQLRVRLRAILEKLKAKSFEAEFSLEEQGLEIAISGLIEGESAEQLKKFDVLLNIIEISSSVKAQSRRAMARLNEVIDEVNTVLEPLEAQPNLSSQQEKDKAQCETTIQDRTKKKEKKEKRHKKLIAQVLQFINSDIEDEEDVWELAQKMAQYFKTEQWMPDQLLDDDLLASNKIEDLMAIEMALDKLFQGAESICPRKKLSIGKTQLFMITTLLAFAGIVGVQRYRQEQAAKTEPAFSRKIFNRGLKPSHEIKQPLGFHIYQIPKNATDRLAKATMTKSCANIIFSFLKEHKKKVNLSKKALAGQMDLFTITGVHKGGEVTATIRLRRYREEKRGSTKLVPYVSSEGEVQNLLLTRVRRYFDMRVHFGGALSGHQDYSASVITSYTEKIKL